MVKLKHPQPSQYKVEYVLYGSMLSSTNYYSVFDSSETLIDLLHVFTKTNIKGSDINILSIKEYCPYSKKWSDKTEKAIQKMDSEKLIVNGSSILWKNNAIAETA
mgnify:CR=1 FL=1